MWFSFYYITVEEHETTATGKHLEPGCFLSDAGFAHYNWAGVCGGGGGSFTYFLKAGAVLVHMGGLVVLLTFPPVSVFLLWLSPLYGGRPHSSLC